ARIEPGMHIAITAAGSTIGRMLIRMANRVGITPIAFVRSDRAAARVAGLPAQVVLCRTAADTATALALVRTTDGLVDAIFDCVGGPGAVPLGRRLRRNGLFIHYGLLSGAPIPAAFWSENPHVRTSMFHLRQW